MVRSSKKNCVGTSPSGSSSVGGGNRKDPAWRHSVEVENPGGKKHYVYLECKYCKKVIKGGVKRMKDHLAHTRKNVAPCKEVPEHVKNEFVEYLSKGTKNKLLAQAQFDERIDSGAYFGSVMDGGTKRCNPISSTRGVRGPMDRFIMNLDDDEEDVRNKAIPIQQNSKEMRNRVCLDIGRFFFENAISFNAARSPSFFSMCRSIGSYGRGLKPPSMHELRTWILREELKTTKNVVDEIKKTWPQTGVSIMSDGWKDIRQRNLINFLVNNPSGTVFLKSVDASEYIKDAKLIFKLLDEVIEEVGEHLVVQVITDNASNYKAAGDLLMEKRKHLYWTPCAAHCIDLMLERIGDLPQHKNALFKARKVANYIYNHSWLLALMRKFTKREILRPAATRFATAFLTLQSMYQVRQPLEAIFTSEEWISCAFANKSEGKAVRKIVLKDKSFWPSVIYAIKTTKSLVEVLRLVDAEKEPAMGYLYNAMDLAKEKIAKNLGGEEKDYKEIWEIIDEKWDVQLHRHLHAAAYYLNPRCHYDPGFSNHPEIKLGLFHCKDKLILDPEDRVKADLQCSVFHNKEGFFGFNQAKLTFDKRSPVEWWIQFGDGTPELQRFAIKILGLTCSSSGCERNWSTYNQVHTKRRNRLSTLRMNTLVYIMYNKKLKDRHLKLKSLQNDEDALLVNELSSDDEWLIGENDEEDSPKIDDEELDVDVFGEEDLPSGVSGIQSRSTKSHNKNTPETSKAAGKRKKHVTDVDENYEELNDLDSDDGEDDRATRYDDTSEDPSSHDDLDDY